MVAPTGQLAPAAGSILNPGTQYNIALLIFFVPYVLFEIPSNILLKRFSPRVWRKRY